jgi:hypothetical protein
MPFLELRTVKLPVKVFTSESIEGVRPVSVSFNFVRNGIYE